MRMQHQFTVPVPIDVAWSALLDPERVAPCMPGATLTKAEGNEFAGSVKVRLGPISLLYKGNGTFSDVDADARRVVIDASGKDSRGNGTAAATVTAVLTDGGSSTSVTVDTDLKVTGKPAQLGRGLISEVGGKIITQFSECLAGRLSGETAESGPESAGSEQAPSGAGGSESTGPEAASASTGAGTAESASAQGRPNGERTASAGSINGGKPSPTASSGRSSGGKPVGRRPAWRVTPPADEGAEVAAASSTAKEVPSAKADAVVTGERMPSDEAIDLLGTAGAPVLKRVVPVVAAIVVIIVLLRLRRRRRR